VVSVLAIGPQVRGFRPGVGDGYFKGDKNPQNAFLWRGSKAVSPMSYYFMICERTLLNMKEIIC
jgi:hypothetical protein